MKKDNYIPKHVLPDYERAGRLAKRLRRSSLGNFAAFPLELARTTYNMVMRLLRKPKGSDADVEHWLKMRKALNRMTNGIDSTERLGEWAEYLKANEEWMLTADGFDEAFIGVTELKPLSSIGVTKFKPEYLPLAVYSYEKCVDILMQRDGMDREEALEYMEFNVTGAYVGKQTPVFVRELP